MGGIYTTKHKALVEFTLPEFSTNKTISCVCHVDESADPHLTHYDMIIGDELLKELGIDLRFIPQQFQQSDGKQSKCL
jgi:hypothetical protein